MSSEIPAVKVYSDNLLRFNDRIGEVLNDWHDAVRGDDAELFAAFSARIRQFQEFRRELVRRAVEISPASGREWGDNDANRTVRTALNNDLEALARIYATRSKLVNAEIDRSTATAVWLLSILSGLAVLLAAFGAIIIWRAVAAPLAKITRATQAVIEGTREIVVPFAERGDEIGALARSITIFQETMRRNEELNQAGTAAKARDHQQEKISAKIARFSTEIEATLADLGQICENMLGASAQLTGAADHAASRTATATKASTEASASVSDIAAAADELSSSINEIDRQVGQSNTIANKAVAEAERTHATVRELNETAGRIGDVLRLITDVAEQTNLLALNATIEAARAGDAGRGFAVVASEVKMLSGQTAKATEDIGAQVARMQRATLGSIEAIAAIEITIRKIGDISSVIATAVTQQGMATHRIARSAEIAADRTVASAGEVERVFQAATDTHASVTAVNGVADELGAFAIRIRDQIHQFFEHLHAA
jgi:methyl-accepting chemotaxis protein